MILVFITPIQSPPDLYFGVLPSRAVVHAILFLGFTHTMIGAMKKQLKQIKIREKAVIIALIIATSISILSEIAMYLGGVKVAMCPWTFTFNMLGTFLGIGTFKLLYRTCC